MSGVWALRLARDNAKSLAILRCLSGVQAGEREDEVWLRGDANDEGLSVQLQSIPGATRFEVLPDQQLIELGQRVPAGKLPDLHWQPLPDWLQIALPEACGPGRFARRVPIRLVRSSMVSRSELLVTTIDAWFAWACRAPRARLDPLRFAADDDGRVAIHGSPLPPLPGERFTFAEGIAVPAGWTSTPAVDAETLRDAMGLAPGDVALLSPQGSWELIESDQFVRASRSAVRATAEAGHDG